MKLSKTIVLSAVGIYLTLSFPAYALEGMMSPIERDHERRIQEVRGLAEQIRSPLNNDKEVLFKKLESYIPASPVPEGRFIIMGFGDAADFTNGLASAALETVVDIMQTSSRDQFLRANEILFKPELVTYGSLREIESFLTHDNHFVKWFSGPSIEDSEVEFRRREILRSLARWKPQDIANHESYHFDTIYFLEMIFQSTVESSPEIAEVAALQLTNLCMEESRRIRLQRQGHGPWKPWKDGYPFSEREQHCRNEAHAIFVETQSKTRGTELGETLNTLEGLLVLPTKKGIWPDKRGKIDRTVVPSRLMILRDKLQNAAASLS